MAQTEVIAPVDPSAGGHLGRRRHRAALAGAVVFALSPWASLGFATPIAFVVAALAFRNLGRVHTVVLWLSAAIYTATLIVAFAHVDAAPCSAGEHVFVACVLISMVGGGLQALGVTITAAAKGYRPIAHRPRERHPQVDTGATPVPAAIELVGVGEPRRQAWSPRLRVRDRQPSRPGGNPKTAHDIPPGTQLLMALTCLGLGIAVSVSGIREQGIYADLATRGIPTQATVVAVDHKSMSVPPSGRLQEWTVLTVAYSDVRGTPRRATRNGSDSTKVGDSLHIMYDPLNPSHVSWDGADNEVLLDWFAAAQLLLLGLYLLVNALVRIHRQPPAPRGPSTDPHRRKSQHAR